MFRGEVRSHQSLTQEMLRTPSVSAYPVSLGDPMQGCVVEEGDTWMMPYRRYLADGILLLESAEAKKIKKNSAKYTLVDGELYRHGFTHPILVCVSGDQCTRIMESSMRRFGVATWEGGPWRRRSSVRVITGQQ